MLTLARLLSTVLPRCEDPSVTVQPLRLAFRRELRSRALAAAAQLALESGWDRVRMGGVAAAVGVSRPTLYKEFGDKEGLGQALVQEETERFLVGVSAALAEHDADPPAAIRAAVRFTLQEADRSPLLRAVLTSTRTDAIGLLPLLTTRSAPLLDTARAVVVEWLGDHYAHVAAQDRYEAADAVVRLVVSHLVVPAAAPEPTAEHLARIALRYLGADRP